MDIGGSKVNRIIVAALLGILASPLVVQTTFTVGELSDQEVAGTMHEHLTGVSCDDVPPGQKRPEFGCFNIAMIGKTISSPQARYHHRRCTIRREMPEDLKTFKAVFAERGGGPRCRIVTQRLGAGSEPPPSRLLLIVASTFCRH